MTESSSAAPTLRVEAIEDRLDRIVMRQCVTEAILATTIGLILRSTNNDDLRRDVMRELRNAVQSKTYDVADPKRAERLVLELDEATAQLLDQIEGLARA